MTEPDRVASALAGWRDAERDATPGPWIRYGIADDEVWAEKPWDHVAETMGNTADAKFIADARTALPALLAAIEAALKAAEKWDERARTLFVVAQQMQQGPGSGREYSRALAYDKCSRALREAITAELAGKDADDGR